MIYVSAHFKFESIAPKGFGGDLSCFYPDYPEFLEQIRSVVGPMIINDYHLGKQWRGLRLPSCPEWSPGSQHSYIKESGKLCAAFDATPLEYSADRARELLIAANPALLGRLEGGVSWLHCDMGPRIGGKIHVFHK